jgi:hypothetical protein
MKVAMGLLLTCVWLAGCETKYDQLKSGDGCRSEDTLAGARGRCSGDQLVCQLGMYDGDGVASNGCESTLQATGDTFLFQLSTRGMAILTINEYRFDNDTAGGWVAVAGPVTTCDASPSSPCHYELLALQLGIPSFLFDGMDWTDGLIELPQPLSVVDQGNGISIPEGTTFVASFMIEGNKRVVSRGTAMSHSGIVTNGTQLVFDMSSELRIPFGGYTLENVVIRVTAVTPAP